MPATVAIVRCPSYEPSVVEAALEEAFRLLGGLASFIQQDEQVLLKPNLLAAARPDEQATTHPAVVAGVIRQVQRAGGRPVIGDSPAFGSLASVAEATGIAAVARGAGVPLIALNRPTRLPVTNPVTRRWLTGDPRVIAADVLLNLPKLTSHTQTRLTGAVKNLYGCVPGTRKIWWHFQARHDLAAFSDLLVENVRAVQSALTVVDAVVAMEGAGPRRGTPRPVGVLVAGADPVAVDAVLGELVGLPPAEHPILQAAARRGVGTWRLAEIRVVGEPLAQARVPGFRLLAPLQDISFDLPRVARSTLRQGWLRLARADALPRASALRLVQGRMSPYAR